MCKSLKYVDWKTVKQRKFELFSLKKNNTYIPLWTAFIIRNTDVLIRLNDTYIDLLLHVLLSVCFACERLFSGIGNYNALETHVVT